MSAKRKIKLHIRFMLDVNASSMHDATYSAYLWTSTHTIKLSYSQHNFESLWIKALISILLWKNGKWGLHEYAIFRSGSQVGWKWIVLFNLFKLFFFLNIFSQWLSGTHTQTQSLNWQYYWHLNICQNLSCTNQLNCASTSNLQTTIGW